MRKRLLLLFLLISILSILLSLMLSVFVFYDIFERNMKDVVSVELSDLSIALESGVPIESFARVDRRQTLVTSQGIVLYDSAMDAAMLENHLQRKEIQQALSMGLGYDERMSNSLGHKQMYFAKRLTDGNVLRISADVLSMGSFLLIVSGPLTLTLMALLALVILISNWLTRSIVSPLNEVDLENPERNDSYPEISPLLKRIALQKALLQEQVLKAEQTRREFDSIIAAMDEGLAVIGKNGDVLTRNDSFDRLLCIENASSGPQPVSVFSLHSSQNFNRMILGACKGERCSGLEWVGSRCLEVSVTPAEGGIIVLLQDVTEKEAREGLRREFSANVSHELKTPLTTISGFAELIGSGSVPADKVMDFANEILKESERLKALVSDILNLSRLDEGILPAFTAVDLSSVCDEVVRSLSMEASANEVRISSEIEENCQVLGEEKMLFQIVYNLVDNAIRYNRKDGSVHVALHRSASKIDLSVSDTGIGIPMDCQDRVFERFFRVDKSRSKEKGGTGLGLSVVKNNVQRLDAKLTLKSKVGEGTRIDVSFRCL